MDIPDIMTGERTNDFDQLLFPMGKKEEEWKCQICRSQVRAVKVLKFIGIATILYISSRCQFLT